VAKIRYDVSDVESGERNYVQPKPGLYDAKVVEANARQTDGKNDIEVIVELTAKGEYQGARLWGYVHLGEASRWKVRELTDAVGLPAKGTIDTDKLVGKKLKVKVSASEWEGEYRARLQRFLSASDADDGDDAEEEEGEGEGEDYSTWSLDDLKAEVEERGLEGNITGSKTKKKLIEVLEGDDNGPASGEEEEEEEEEEEDDAEDDAVDYSSMSLGELKEAASEAGLTVKGPKSKYVTALEEWAASGDAEDDDEAEPEYEDDYDEWELEELTSEVSDRELKVTGRKTKEKLIAALRADDASPF